MAGLRDDQLAALRLLERHRALERVDRDRRLIVGRRLGGELVIA